MLRGFLVVTVVSLGMWTLGAVVAEDKPAAGKEVTVTGSLMCAKCKLKTPGLTDCQNALQVKVGEKTVTYILQDQGNGEDYHQCGKDEKPGVTVAGILTEKDGKQLLKPTKVTTPK